MKDEIPGSRRVGESGGSPAIRRIHRVGPREGSVGCDRSPKVGVFGSLGQLALAVGREPADYGSRISGEIGASQAERISTADRRGAEGGGVTLEQQTLAVG